MIQILHAIDGAIHSQNFESQSDIIGYLEKVEKAGSSLITLANLKSYESITGTRTILLRALRANKIENLLGGDNDL